MSTQTTNLGLTKPAGNERPLVGVLNGNMDIIDAAVGDLQESVLPSTESGWTVLRLGGNFAVAMRTYATQSIELNSAWGGLYYGSVDPLSLPVTFSNVVCYRVYALNNNAWALGYFGAGSQSISGNTTGQIYLVSAGARAAEVYLVSIIVCGYIQQ